MYLSPEEVEKLRPFATREVLAKATSLGLGNVLMEQLHDLCDYAATMEQLYSELDDEVRELLDLLHHVEHKSTDPRIVSAVKLRLHVSNILLSQHAYERRRGPICGQCGSMFASHAGTFKRLLPEYDSTKSASENYELHCPACKEPGDEEN